MTDIIPRVPNIQWPGVDPNDGSMIWPRTDVEAKAAGLAKVINTTDSTVRYIYPVDAMEYEATGEWTWERWT